MTSRSRLAGGPALLTLMLVAAGGLQPSAALQPPAMAPPDPQTTVLFLCPRGAAKSVLASAYFRQLAAERGLNVRVESAGTDPDTAIAPAVAAHPAKGGYAVPSGSPRAVTRTDLETADVVISIGCRLDGLPPPRGTVVNWDVPALSDDFGAADEAIRRRVSDLVEELLRRRPGTLMR